MTPVLWVVVAALLIAALVLMSAAARIFRSAFLRVRSPSPPGYDPFRDSVPEEYQGRFRSGYQWITSDKRALERLQVVSADGLKLRGYLLLGKDPRRFMVLVHGYHSSALYDLGCAAKFYHRLGYSLLMTDMRTHGESEGRIVCFGLKEHEDLQLWIEALQRRFGEDIDVFLHGLSMGATTVMMAAGKGVPPCVRGVIADCGFTSPHDIVRYLMVRNYHMRFPPLIWALSAILWITQRRRLSGYSTLTAMRACKVPVLLVHGGKDDFVPTDMSERNYQACACEKQLFIVPEAGHATSYLVDTRGYVERVTEFLKKHQRELPPRS